MHYFGISVLFMCTVIVYCKSIAYKKKENGGGCFIAEDTVISELGVLKMSELVNKKHVKVLTYNSKAEFEMSPVIYWIHSNPAQVNNFLLFSTESGHKLHISHLHLIYVSDCTGTKRTVFAKMVQKDHCIFVKNEDGELVESKVVDIREVNKVGVYAPLTENGNIVVNDVLASCFTNFNDEEQQKHIFSFIIWTKYCFELIFPRAVIDLIYSNPLPTFADIPDLYLAFHDLYKVFMR